MQSSQQGLEALLQSPLDWSSSWARWSRSSRSRSFWDPRSTMTSPCTWSGCHSVGRRKRSTWKFQQRTCLKKSRQLANRKWPLWDHFAIPRVRLPLQVLDHRMSVYPTWRKRTRPSIWIHILCLWESNMCSNPLWPNHPKKPPWPEHLLGRWATSCPPHSPTWRASNGI